MITLIDASRESLEQVQQYALMNEREDVCELEEEAARSDEIALYGKSKMAIVDQIPGGQSLC